MTLTAPRREALQAVKDGRVTTEQWPGESRDWWVESKVVPPIERRPFCWLIREGLALVVESPSDGDDTFPRDHVRLTPAGLKALEEK